MDFNRVNEDLSELLKSANGCEYTDSTDGMLDRISASAFENFNVLHLNIRSFHKNSDNLLVLLKDLRDKGIVIHVIGLCETFLSDVSTSTAVLENYYPFHRCRPNRTGGGVLLFLHGSVMLVRTLETPFTNELESTAVVVKYKGKEACACEFYRPPNSSDSKFMTELNALYDTVSKYNLSFVCSDQNYDLLKTHLHKPTRDFLASTMEAGFTPYISKPMRITHVSSTLIDNIFVKASPMRTNSSYIILDGMSVHYPCLLSYEISHTKIKTTEIVLERRKLNDDNMLKIQQDLLFYEWDDLNLMNVNASYEYLISVIQSTARTLTVGGGG